MRDGRKRAFIVSHERFPRESAGANYIQYLALALLEERFAVVVIGENNKAPTGWEKSYRGIEYATCNNSASGKSSLSAFDLRELGRIFEHYLAGPEDRFIFYNPDLAAMRHCVGRYGSGRMFGVRVEFMQPYQYKLNRLNPKYIAQSLAIRYMWRRFRGDFAISSLLKGQDERHGLPSMLLPIMADPYEYEWIPDKRKEDEVHLVYPGMKVTGYEDDLETIFSALASLDPEKRRRVRLHITGTSRERIDAALPGDILERIRDNLQLHGFLPYDQLVELYRNMDGLVLIRKVNEITRANFPSKIPELLAYGVIPICTDVGDYTKDYLNDACALIVPPYDQAACVKAIERIIDLDQEEYAQMRRAARRVAEERFYYRRWSGEIAGFIARNEGK